MSFFRKKSRPGTDAAVVIGQSSSRPSAQIRETQQQQQQPWQPQQEKQPNGGSFAQSIPSEPSKPASPGKFPWSIHSLSFPPPIEFPGSRTVTSIATHSPSPFPRYGHSLSPTADGKGDLYLFGGLVRDSLRSDLYVISTHDLSASVVHTAGDLPTARVGHASVIISKVLIIWGGDTGSKTPPGKDHWRDSGLYMFNIITREWTVVKTHGGPQGRYGHTMTSVGTNLFVFGGQISGQFLNDLWKFDLKSLKYIPAWEEYQPADGIAPYPRTGHVCVTFEDKIYVFGGTDGKFHYNDTWSFDVGTRKWEEVQCIGFIPSPREGHAATMVGEIMYIFGGRGVDGTDLGDLAGLRITDKRWYMFANMGPQPSARSGHAIGSSGTRAFVIGGESAGNVTQQHTDVIHILNTNFIKYPPLRGYISDGIPGDQIKISSDHRADIPESGSSSPDGSQWDALSATSTLVPQSGALKYEWPGVSASRVSQDKKSCSLSHSKSDIVPDIDPFMDHLMASPTRPNELEPYMAGVRLEDGDEYSLVPDLSKHMYNITGPRCAGRYCDIYVGELQREDRPDTMERVAMKMLRVFSAEEHILKAKRKFRQEVDVWRSLRHPNILTFYGTCEIGNRLFMVSSWAPGGNSLEYLRRNPTENRGNILLQTARALKYLHSGKDIQQIIVHGDLKADNVLISKTGDVLLSDFGLSGHMEEVIAVTTSSSTYIPGPIRFMAPELIRPPKNSESSRSSNLTPASDVFAFASLALQLYTEKPPFSHLSEIQAMFEIVNGMHPLQPREQIVLERGFHDAVWTLMTECWNINAERRPTMAEVVWRMETLF